MRIRQTVVDDVFEHARETAPRECCGLLLGLPDYILLNHRATNLLESPGRYLVDPFDHFAAIRVARTARLEVIGAYHSHPTSAALPSPTDLNESIHAEFLYLIVSPGTADLRPELRAYYLSQGNFQELILVPMS